MRLFLLQVEVTEMNGSVDHHFLDIGARDGELEARGLSSDEVVMDCLDVPCQFELDPQEISQVKACNDMEMVSFVLQTTNLVLALLSTSVRFKPPSVLIGLHL